MKGKRVNYIILFVWCILIVFFLLIFEQIMYPYLTDSYMPCRITYMNRYINELKGGVFPQITASGNSDHAIGIYILGAYLGKWLQIDGKDTFRLITLVVFYTTIIIFPILIQRIYKCKIATYISPILLCFFFSDQLITVHQDSYVGIGICMVVLSIPMILILNQCESHFHKVQLLLGLIVLMSFANIGREHTSLGLFFILIYLIILEMIRAVKNKRWLELVVYFALGLITLLSYNLCATTIPNFLLRINGQEQWLTSSTAWHSIYIGFGFFENPYNIIYLDECMMEKVKEISPNIIYASNEYYDTCKELVMKLLNEDFLFCIKSFVMKAIYTLGGMVLATLRRVTRDLCIAYILFNMYKNRFNINKGFLYKRKDIIIVGCIFILAGIAPAILTAPWIHYCITAYATCQVGIMLLFLYLLENKVNSRR